MYTIPQGKKITKTTVKKFIRENRQALLINVKSSFDGMTDGCEPRNGGFQKAEETERHIERSLGIDGAWFVGDSRDYFEAYETASHTGVEVYNSCGQFILAIQKEQ